MRRSRLTASLLAVVMAASALLVPGTAHADVTDVSVSVDFDNLSPDRTATVTLKAKSESGVADVEAKVQHRPAAVGDWTPIGMLPFDLVDGTENDGTWRAAYEVDIESYPGFIGFDVAVTTADGGTWNRLTGLGSCYEGQFTDLTSVPAVVDPAEMGVRVRGRLLLRKTRDSEPEPAPQGIVIRDFEDALTRTAADGSFALTVSAADPTVRVPGGQLVCNVTERARYLVSWMDTEISASIVTPQPVEVGAEVTVRGAVHSIVRGEREALANMTVGGHAGYQVGGVDSAEDGTFEFTFTARHSGPVTVRTMDRVYLLRESQTTAGMLNVTGAPGFSAFDVAVEPGPAGSREDAIIATGRLVKGDTPLAGEQIDLRRSTDDQESWTLAGTTVTAEDGSFTLRGTADLDAYYRMSFAGSEGNVSAISPAEYVNVRDLTFIEGFGGRPVTDGVVGLQGRLHRSQDRRPMGSSAVHFYFLPAGESAWEYRGSTATDGNGVFAGEFTEHRNGDWTAWFWGDAEYSAADAPVATVQMRDHWTTEISRFDVLPRSVAAGEPVTVSGVLSRFREGSDPHRTMASRPVHVYFQHAGSSTWRKVAVVSTDGDGTFEKAFTADQDGSWTAWFWGDGGHAQVNSGTRYVDVQ